MCSIGASLNKHDTVHSSDAYRWPILPCTAFPPPKKTSQLLKKGFQFPTGLEGTHQPEWHIHHLNEWTLNTAGIALLRRIATPIHHAQDAVLHRSIPRQHHSPAWIRTPIVTIHKSRVGVNSLPCTPQPHCATQTRCCPKRLTVRKNWISSSPSIPSPMVPLVSLLQDACWVFFILQYAVASRAWDAQLSEGSACSLWEELPICDGKHFKMDKSFKMIYPKK